MSVRTWYVAQALGSFRTLSDVLGELTEEEVLRCLHVEAGSSRRRSVIDRLISRAARINELNYTRQLKEKFHGKDPQQDHERR